MLSFFRRGPVAKLMLLVLGIGIFAIVITGFGTGGGGLGGIDTAGSGGAIASVDGEKLTAADVTQVTQQELARFRQQQPDLDLTAFLRQGSLEIIVDQMIDMAAITAFGEDMGLVATRAMVEREIQRDPRFRNLAGQFDNATFQRFLQSEKVSEQKYRDDVANRLIQRQLVAPAAGSVFVPQGFAAQYASLLLEKRSGLVGAVPAAAMGPGREPTDAEVATFYQQNIGRYTIPERRTIRYALFGRETVAAATKPTDAEIQAAYKRDQATYGARETRSLSQVVLPDEASARSLAQKIAAGTAFDAAALQAGFGAGDIAVGEQSRDAYARISAPNVANAVFGAAEGATVGPLRSPLGWHVVRVDQVKAVAGRPFEAVRAEIAAKLEQEKSVAALGDLAGRIETAISEGANFQEIAQREKLSVQETPPVTGSGAAPGAAQWQPTPELQPLLRTAFEVEANAEPVVEAITPNERFAMMIVTNVVPAAAPPVAQIRDRVKADLIARRANDRARAIATALLSKINAGTSPAQAFAEAQVKLPGVQPVTAARIDIARQGQQVPPPLAMLFSLPRGKAKLIPAPNGAGWFVVYLDKIVPGDASKEAALIASVKNQFSEVVGNEYVDQLSAAVRARTKVKRNEEAVQALKKQLTGGGQ
nr:peptidyl-prolyl cis-trans isomerase [Sphingomonas deserti]